MTAVGRKPLATTCSPKTVIFRKRKKQARRYVGQVVLKPETLDRA